MSVCASIRQTVSPLGTSSDDLSTFDSGTASSVDSLLGPERIDPDSRIRQRLEASRQGMLQLETLRNKHQKLMEEMRIRWPHSSEDTELRNRENTKVDENVSISQTEIKLNDSRCDSPMSCCVSHRSSMSMDSGCVSASSDPSSQSPMPYSTYRKLSIEEQRKKVEQNAATDENPRIVATAIESTTAVRCHGPKRYMKNWQRPKSMCSSYPDENAVIVDSHSFSQITPPPIHRKFTTVGRSESVQTVRRPCSATSCLDVRSLTIPKDQTASTVRFAVNQSPVLQAKPVTVAVPNQIQSIPSSPHSRLRNPQKPVYATLRSSPSEPQSIFHASRVFVDQQSPRNLQRPIPFAGLKRFDSDDDSPRPLRAQPAIVISRQPSYAHSNESSPTECRKLQPIEASTSLSNIALFGQQHHYQLNRRESSLSSETVVSERPRRRMKEKDWKESEGL